jgi:hypothetical protein
MTHEGCGGAYKKFGKRPGRYRCAACGFILKLGRGAWSLHRGLGYIKAQKAT